ncbi:MAG TPA: toluene monooxygenase [Burkholderiaceae bacterium]|nr:toluene monooxygenase [Burkholderiaceae bacterium]
MRATPDTLGAAAAPPAAAASADKLDWTFHYVREDEVFPPAISGTPWLQAPRWSAWNEPFKTTYADYVATQADKEAAVAAVRDLLARPDYLEGLDPAWRGAAKLHAATLPLAEFAAVIGNLRAARFGRDSAWRKMALFGALDECRHTQIPLLLMHPFLSTDRQFDWTHLFYHSNNWVAIAARHCFDELLLTANPIEFAIGTNFVLETGFTNLQFVGLSSLAHGAHDKLFEKMVTSIQTDEARHAQIGGPVLEVVLAEDPDYAQYLVDKWFWRSWLLFSIVTGFSMDYLTPLSARRASFREFMEEWVLDQFLSSLASYGLKRPWYWETFERALLNYHHMVYLSAYTYRATVWFDMVMPGPAERRWLAAKYPETWDQYDGAWEHVAAQWQHCDPGVDFGVHGTAIPGFCHLCQLVLCQGTPAHNDAVTHEHEGARFIFCSEPCRRIFAHEPARYAHHQDLVKRVLAGAAPGNLIAMLTRYFRLDYDTWGKDAYGGTYPWLGRAPKDSRGED